MVIAQETTQITQPTTETFKPLIDLEDIGLVYGKKKSKKQILQHLNLSIYNGEFVCVLGPSGSGKTSLLKMIAGYESPSEGTIKIKEALHKGPGPDIGVVFQHANLFPWMSVEKNIGFGLKMKKVPKEKRQQLVTRYMDIVNLKNAAKLLPHELSGGMKQRVAIARALAPDPEIILMDEPFAALDSINRQSLQDELRQIWLKTKKTVFFITHDVDEAMTLGSRVIVLNERPGKLVLDVQNPLITALQAQPTIDFRELDGYKDLRHRLLKELEHA